MEESTPTVKVAATRTPVTSTLSRRRPPNITHCPLKPSSSMSSPVSTRTSSTGSASEIDPR